MPALPVPTPMASLFVFVGLVAPVVWTRAVFEFTFAPVDVRHEPMRLSLGQSFYAKYADVTPPFALYKVRF